jgi:hypothetical protein
MAYPSGPTYPSTGETGGGGGGGTQPSLSVADRIDGEGYTITAGARSLTITAAAGATLSTTVELASTGLPVSVTGGTTSTPSWTAADGGTDGDAYAVRVVATLDGLTSTVGWTERVAGVANTEPALSVSGITDGEAYTVTAGAARSLTITTDAGATLSTTVELATGAPVTVTGAATTSPSWTVPAGGTAGDAYQVRVVSTLDGLSSSVGFTERIAGAAAPSVSVAGITDGEAYTVTGGAARSLTITADAGATLSTTVEVASTGLPLAVTDSTTTTPSWTAPAGGATGEAVQVQVTATASGASSTVSWTERTASAGLYDVATEVVDLTDGTWTLYDPDSLVQSISFDSGTGEHTVTMNELAAPNSNYNPCGGTGYTGPRWYKALEISGNAVNADDVITMIHTADGTITTAGWNQRNIWGTTCNPTGLIVGNTGICGIGIVWESPAGTEQGVYRLGNAYTQASALSVNQWGLIQRGRDHVLGSLNTSFKSNGAVSTVSGNVLEQILGPAQYGLPVYLYFGLGIKTNTSTIPLNAQTKFKLGYQALTLTGV